MKKVLLRSGTAALREKCPYSELFLSAFSRIRTEYGEIRSKNADQNNSEYGDFLRSENRCSNRSVDYAELVKINYIELLYYTVWQFLLQRDAGMSK